MFIAMPALIIRLGANETTSVARATGYMAMKEIRIAINMFTTGMIRRRTDFSINLQYRSVGAIDAPAAAANQAGRHLQTNLTQARRERLGRPPRP
jgi:hypothetical protein